MNKQKTVNPRLRIVWVIALAVSEFSVFALFKENSLVGAAFDGALGAIIAWVIVWLISKLKGTDMLVLEK